MPFSKSWDTPSWGRQQETLRSDHQKPHPPLSRSGELGSLGQVEIYLETLKIHLLLLHKTHANGQTFLSGSVQWLKVHILPLTGRRSVICQHWLCGLGQVTTPCCAQPSTSGCKGDRGVSPTDIARVVFHDAPAPPSRAVCANGTLPGLGTQRFRSFHLSLCKVQGGKTPTLLEQLPLTGVAVTYQLSFSQHYPPLCPSRQAQTETMGWNQRTPANRTPGCLQGPRVPDGVWGEAVPAMSALEEDGPTPLLLLRLIHCGSWPVYSDPTLPPTTNIL